MKEIKTYLNTYKNVKAGLDSNDQDNIKSVNLDNIDQTLAKLEYVPGTIVRVKLSEPCQSDKKIKVRLKIFIICILMF